MPEIPSSSAFLTSLLSQLSSSLSSPASATANPLQEASFTTKNLILTLHCLFPHDFVPALDLLDRRLVTRIIIDRKLATSDEAHQGAILRELPRDNIVYYVRSAQQPRTSRYHSAAVDTIATSYEVRLGAWNCSCPAFTFATFDGSIGASIEGNVDDGGKNEGGMEGWRFGGLMLDNQGMPVCKHLLACVLVEKCDGLAGFLEERIVGKEEAAGWAAGWGG